MPRLPWCSYDDQKFIDEIRTSWIINFDNIVLLDFGNRTLINKPKKICSYPNSHFFSKILVRNLKLAFKNTNGVILIFVKFRSQVDFWVEKLQSMDIEVLGCKGGLVKNFTEELLIREKLDCIVTTTALSHGVNLPKIGHIFISYEIKDIDFWIQMVGRGGRKGESYILHHRDMNQNLFLKLKYILNALRFNITKGKC